MDNPLNKDFIKLLETTSKVYFCQQELTALFPIQGNMYKKHRDLMVVGRALNSWGTEKDKMWWGKDKLSKTIANNIIDYSIEENGICSMKWIIDNWDKNYYMNRSAFWRVTKKILNELQITQSKSDWSSYLVWTDLYKISYSEGGNPSNSLMNAQFDECVSFLKKEIKYFRPKRILFLCGYNWFKEFNNGDFIGREYSTNVEWIGKFGDPKVVVAKHPQGKGEYEFVKQVKNAFTKP